MEEAVKVGQEVRLPETHQRGRIVEVDRSLLVARLQLNDGREKWELCEALEIIEPWDNRRRTA